MSYDFADRLIELRRAKGMSQEELASALGLSRQAISKWERAESAPDIGNLVALSELYSISLDEIVRGQASAPEMTDEEVSPADEAPVEEAEVENGAEAAPAPAPEAQSVPATESAPEPPQAEQPTTYEQAYSVLTAEAPQPTAPPAQAAPVQAPAAAQSAVAPRTSKAWRLFPYPLLCVIIFLFLGFFCGLWHPAWIIFLTIPFYYWVVNLILHDPAYIAAHTPSAAPAAQVPAEAHTPMPEVRHD